MKKKNFILIAIFFLLISLPILDSFLSFSPIKQLFEKRLPIEFPKLPTRFNELKLFFKNFENYFNDHYGFRKTLIYINSKMMDNIFDESPDSRAFFGKDNWMFFDNCNSLLDSAGKITIKPELLELGVNSFIRNKHNLEKNNIEYLVVIAPDKSTVYSQFLPDYLNPSNLNNHRIDQFINALKKADPNFPIIDLRKILIDASKKEIVYQKTDTHWNRRGAHYAYVEMFNYLAKKNINYAPKLRNNFTNKADEFIRGDISDIMGIEQTNLNYDLTSNFILKSKQIEISEKERSKFHNPFFYKNENPNLPILFAFKDSFFADLFWVVNEHFSMVYSTNESPCDIDLSRFAKYHPNIVIHEFWEGRIEIILNKCKK